MRKVRSFLINNRDTTKQSINFAVTEKDIDIKTLLSLTFDLKTDILDSLDKEFEELEYDQTTTIIELDDITLTRRYIKFPAEIMSKYYDILYDRQRDELSDTTEKVLIYTYELDGKYYHMYNYSRLSFITSSTNAECEFLLSNIILE